MKRLLPIHASDVPVKLGLDIQSQNKARVRKPTWKNPIRLPGEHYESDIAENQQPSAHSHKQLDIRFEIEFPKQIWVTLQKPYRIRTDRVNPAYPPSPPPPHTHTHHHHHHHRRPPPPPSPPPPPPPPNFVGRGSKYLLQNDGLWSWPQCVNGFWNKKKSNLYFLLYHQ